MKFGFNFLKGYNYDSTFLKELEIRLQEFSTRYLQSPHNVNMFKHRVVLLKREGRTLQDARTEAMLLHFLNDSLWMNYNSEYLWSNVIAKRLCEDLKVWFKEQWAFQKSSGNPYLKGMCFWLPAYGYPKNARLVVEPCKVDLEKKINKTIVESGFKNYKRNMNSFLEKYPCLKTRYANLREVREKVSGDPLRFFKDCIDEVAHFANRLYEDKVSRVMSEVGKTEVFRMVVDGGKLMAQQRTNKQLLTNPVANVFDYIRHFKIEFRDILNNPEKHQELCEYYHIITDSV